MEDVTPLAELLGPSARYEPVRLLGRGGMGEVYEAIHRQLGNRVVIKVIRADRASNAQTVERLRREAQALARLTHPNLVRVSDFDLTSAGQPFFVMEYLDGRSLAAELEARRRLDVSEAIDIAVQALAGLSAAHDAGVVHRDVKPDNIFLCRVQSRPLVKVLDFGIAKMIATAGESEVSSGPALTAPGRLLGTPRYVAPEQALLHPLDGRVDVYAMGLVVYEMLTGRGPFDDASDSLELIRAHLGRQAEPPSRHRADLPPTLDGVVMRCLQKQPEQRFGGARELAAALQAVLYGERHEAHAATSAPPVTPVSAPPVATPPMATRLLDRAEAITSPSPPAARSVRPDPRRIPFKWVVVILVASAVLASVATHILYR